MKPRRHPCPICKTPVEWNEQARYRPFCSERCRLIDLGEWFGEGRGIPGEPAVIPEREAGDGDSFPWKGSD